MVNSRKIEDLHPVVREICRKHIEACRKRGVEIIVTSTLRDSEYQEYLYSQGRSRPGNIVTNMRLIGPHGFGLAYDVVPIVKRKAVWNNDWLFLASKNPSSAELNFPSTPIPLLGFHG
ncbi:MAG: M15 family metallopeptidase [Lutisporaceae bacterium]